MKETFENKEEKESKTIRMPKELITEIEKLAKENNRTFSNMVIQILTKYLKLRKDD